MSDVTLFNLTVPTDLEPVYTSAEVLCAVAAIIGNSLVILVFARCRRLRKVTNYYVISLAFADLLVGLLGIPSAIATSVGLPRNFRLCIFMNSILLLLCTGSILSLVAITMDRFFAIVYPLTYQAQMTKKRACCIISGCWITAGIIGLLPTAGWRAYTEPSQPRCFFMEVLDFNYLAFLYFGTIIVPSIFMAVVYAIIYRVVRKQVRNFTFVRHNLPTEYIN